MVGESNQNVFLIQIDASSFAEFEISEFEISRVDCNCWSLEVLLTGWGVSVVEHPTAVLEVLAFNSRVRSHQRL